MGTPLKPESNHSDPSQPRNLMQIPSSLRTLKNGSWRVLHDSCSRRSRPMKLRRKCDRSQSLKKRRRKAAKVLKVIIKTEAPHLRDLQTSSLTRTVMKTRLQASQTSHQLSSKTTLLRKWLSITGHLKTDKRSWSRSCKRLKSQRILSTEWTSLKPLKISKGGTNLHHCGAFLRSEWSLILSAKIGLSHARITEWRWSTLWRTFSSQGRFSKLGTTRTKAT